MAPEQVRQGLADPPVPLPVPVRVVREGELAGRRGRDHAECAARGDACLDSARVAPAAAPGQFTFAHDPHWNREGHRRIGEALADLLGSDPALRRVRTSRPP